MGDFNHQVLSGFPGLILPSPMGASLGLEMFPEMKVMERVHPGSALEDDAPPLATISSVWAPLGDKFFSPETDATVAAVPGLNGNQGFINKFHGN